MLDAPYDRSVDSIPPLGEACALLVTSGSLRSPPVPMMSGDEHGTWSQLDHIQPHASFRDVRDLPCIPVQNLRPFGESQASY